MEKKIAIMQPYFLPYIGYFQLINLADTFIIYDDVNYIKGGWINRNRILVQNKPAYINIEMEGASSNKKINEISINPSQFWRKKLKKKIALAYKNAPQFKNVFPLIEEIIDFQEDNLSNFVVHSIVKCSEFMGIYTNIVRSSQKYKNSNLSGYHRVIDICKKEKGNTYINPSGGKELYNQEIFKEAGLDLYFLHSSELQYNQFSEVFVPNLSILDVLMFHDKSDFNSILSKFKLLN